MKSVNETKKITKNPVDKNLQKKGKLMKTFFSFSKFVTHFSVSLEEIGGNKHRRKAIWFFWGG